MSECQLPDGHEGECDPLAGLDRPDDPFANSRKMGLLRDSKPYIMDTAKDIVLDAEASLGAGEDRFEVIRRTERQIQDLIRQHSTGIDAESREKAEAALNHLDDNLNWDKQQDDWTTDVRNILRTVAEAPAASAGGIDTETRQRAGELAATILHLLDIRVGKYIKLSKTESDDLVRILRTVASAPEPSRDHVPDAWVEATGRPRG